MKRETLSSSIPPYPKNNFGRENTEGGRLILLRRRAHGGCPRGGGVVEAGKGAVFMATRKELTKEQKIRKEIARLRRVFRDLDKNKLQTVESLLRNAAFMAVSLEELQEIINEEGYVVEYQNGENQKGTKQSDAVKTHIAMTKNHASIIKQLTDLVPPEKKKESKLQALRDE